MTAKEYNNLYIKAEKIMDRISEYQKANGDIKTIRYFEKQIVKINNPVLSTMFAAQIKLADLNMHESIVLNWKIPYQCFEFVRCVEGANIELHRQIISNSTDEDTKGWFADFINKKGICLDSDTCEIINLTQYNLICHSYILNRWLDFIKQVTTQRCLIEERETLDISSELSKSDLFIKSIHNEKSTENIKKMTQKPYNVI